MKIANKHSPIPWVAVAVGLCGAQPVMAAATQNASANLSYSVASIVNLTNPGDLSGLQIAGSFQQIDTPVYDGGDYSWSDIVGDGSVSAQNPGLSAAGAFSYRFAVDTSLNSGALNSHHLGWYGLEFTNLGSDVYSISVRLDYDLQVAVTGENGTGSVSVDYFSSDGQTLAGYERADAWLGAPIAASIGQSDAFNFELAAGEAQGLFADVVIESHLEASPVPLPAAAWSFLAGLMGLLGIKKRRSEHGAARISPDNRVAQSCHIQ